MADRPRAAEVVRIEPRGLRREDAARYVGVGISLFDEMVADGRMPKPITINRRVLWDRYRLDAAFSDLSDQAQADKWEAVA